MASSGVALVTGASGGIGLELVRLLAERGHPVVLVARSRDRLEQLAGELGQRYGVAAEVVPVDLADPAAPHQVLAALERRGWEVDVLVNNAGFGLRGSFAELDLARQLEMVQVNVVALTALCRLLLPGMLARGRGRILNVASTAGFQPGPWMAVYYATKAFVLHFSEALAVEVAGSGVTVTAYCPGPTATGFGAASGMDGSRLFALGTAGSRAVAHDAYRAMTRGRVVAVHGLRNRLVALIVRLAPRALVRQVVGALNRGEGARYPQNER